MKPAVCHKATKRVAALVLALTALATAQTSPAWRKVGSAAVDLSLASPATGPVEHVWFSSGGALFARTASGRIFQTADFESWVAAPADTEVAPRAQASAIRLPESGAQIVSVAGDRSSIFGLGRQVSRSQDGGHTWSNLTGYRGRSVIGVAQHSIAVSPLEPNQIVVANDYGVWRTLDGGATWSGLNLAFPNLPVEHIVSTPTGIAGTRIAVEGLGELELAPGGTVWQISGDNDLAGQAAAKQRYSGLLGAEIRAVAASESIVYAGSKDGRIWVSRDSGKSFDPLPYTVGGPVESIWADPAKPNVAVAALGGNGPHVVHTFDFGVAWYGLDSPTLPNAPAHGVAADRTSGSIYLATDKGVFFARADLETASINATWQNLTAALPQVPAADVRLDPAGVQLYIALEGYGIYAASAPHIQRSWRIVDAADSTVRPAAPGSLLSVLGANVSSAGDGNLKYPVLMANENGSQIQVPFEATGANLALALDTANGRLTANLPMQPVSPAILLGAGSVPMLYDADTNLPLDLRNAAHSNGRVAVLATGLGRVHPDWPAGIPAPENAPAVAAPVQAYLDGASLQVTRATLAPGYVGFYLVELQLPSITNAGMSELHVSVDGHESNRVQLWIEP
jgi:uncharacterized protein (TIGR03437 family)